MVARLRSSWLAHPERDDLDVNVFLTLFAIRLINAPNLRKLMRERRHPLSASDRTLARLASLEAIPDPGLSFNQTRFRWIGFHLLPQLTDVTTKILSMFFRFQS